MCLEMVYKKTPPKTGYFYKVFESLGTNLKFPFECQNARRGEWLESGGGNIYSDHWNDKYGWWIPYPRGFHGMTTLRGAKKFIKEYWAKGNTENLVILRVRYSGGHTAGRQSGNCIVASKIYIPKNAKDLRKKK